MVNVNRASVMKLVSLCRLHGNKVYTIVESPNYNVHFGLPYFRGMCVLSQVDTQKLVSLLSHVKTKFAKQISLH